MFGGLVLWSWPIVVAVLFWTCSKPVALLASIIAGYLLLPTQIGLDLPVLPLLDKDSIPAIAAFIVVLMMDTKNDTTLQPGWVSKGFLPRSLVFMLLVSSFLTVLSNGDPLIYGAQVLPALRPWDAFSSVLTMLATLLPFFLGRKLLARPNQQRLVLIALVATGVLYSFLALYEVRMSPQLNNMIYGFFPHSWLQHIRGDGFRPIVFLNHGLWLAIFFSGAILAAFSLMRLSDNSYRFVYFGAGLWLILTLILAKSLGALIITLFLIPAVALLKTRKQTLVAATMASIVLIYPMLRGADLIPVDTITGWAESVSTDRAGSLSFRLDNEEMLLEKASERPLLGWGGWGRSFVYDDSGRDISVTDGYWIIIIGIGGWIRYFTVFGLLCFPPILAALHTRRYQIGLESSVLMLILAGNLVDLIPNATITPLTWMIAGSVWGRLELGQISETESPQPQTPQQNRRLVYSRYSKETITPEPAKQHRTPEALSSPRKYTGQKTGEP